MNRFWLTVAATVVIGVLAGVALAGAPSDVDQTVIPPTSTAPATSSTVPAGTAD
ncbi:MAG: hypothetical protein F2873_00245 [Actinobacteria bacterium]|uniref:Unannotated protein n=1 Tax=freshwater metagenome TaxID=449393 RepID=A0A6J6XRW1_9ZZZZ|nr:hypothetical protein [Actinomycetota bacterium]MSX79339.1 hypothetical protein [Actinomycetota bacterium]